MLSDSDVRCNTVPLLASQEYRELEKKQAIVEADRVKIEAVIAELDQRKIESLHKTWTKERLAHVAQAPAA